MPQQKRNLFLYGAGLIGVVVSLIVVVFLQPDPNVELENTPGKELVPSNSLGVPLETSSQTGLQTAALTIDDAVQRQVLETPKTLANYFSPNLEGTDIDGRVRLGPDGNIVLDLAVKDFIDYFLSASDDVTPEVAINEMLNVVEASLGPAGKAQMMELLDSYLAYREQAMELMAQPMLPSDQQTREYQIQMMESTLDEMRQLRRANMTDEAVEAFFGLEEAYEDYSLRAMKVQMDDTLSQEQKAKMVAYHRSQLPPIIRRTEERMVEDQKRHRERYEAISTAKDEQELAQKLSEQDISVEQKREILDDYRYQQEFDARYKVYAQERRRQLASVSTEEQKDAITDSLLEKHFSNEADQTQARLRDLRG